MLQHGRLEKIEIGETANSSPTDTSKRRLAHGLPMRMRSVVLESIAATVGCAGPQKRESGGGTFTFAAAMAVSGDLAPLLDRSAIESTVRV